MKEIQGDLWDYYNKPNHFVCITTNGFVKKNGEAVMGRGCALEAKQMFPQVAYALGQRIKTIGNKPGWLTVNEFGDKLFIFPVKHNWWEEADLKLIDHSLAMLMVEALNNPSNIYVLPRPGCGNGRLSWSQVGKMCQYLPDNVLIIGR